MNFTSLGGRRFALVILTQFMTTGLQVFGKIDASGSTYAWVILGTVGAYITGATVESVKKPKLE